MEQRINTILCTGFSAFKTEGLVKDTSFFWDEETSTSKTTKKTTTAEIS